MNPYPFRPTPENRDMLTKEQASRPGVSVNFILNEMLSAGFSVSGRRTARRLKRGAVAIGGAK